MENCGTKERVCLTGEAEVWYVRHSRLTSRSNHYFLEYAAAFFLLADSLKDAVHVILNQLKDLQLAIAVTRVYEGERGPILKELLEDKVLPLASQEGNRWLASWAFWMLHRRDMAVRALIVSHLKPTDPRYRTSPKYGKVTSVHLTRNTTIA